MKPFDFPFKANGSEYVLRYNFRARRAFEDKYKKSVPGILKRLANPDTQTADDLIDIFMVLLSSAMPDIAPNDIETIIEELGGEDPAIELLTNALADQMPKQEAQSTGSP